MINEKIPLFAQVHYDKCREFTRNYFDLKSEFKDNLIHASLVEKHNVDGLYIHHIGFNHGEVLSTNNLKTYISIDDGAFKPIIVFETYFDVSDDAVYLHNVSNETSTLYDNYMRISLCKNIYLLDSGDKSKTIFHEEGDIQKDEYFNLSLEYNMPPYELYMYAKELYKFSSKYYLIYFTNLILDYKI